MREEENKAISSLEKPLKKWHFSTTLL
jgi:hypothetical protein